jgi:hypothetical protein
MIVHAPAGPSPVAAFHDAGDKCLMNYDATDRHFCGLCILRLRGWSVKDEAGGVVALKNVSGQNSA